MRTEAIRHALCAAKTGLLESELDLDGVCDLALAELASLELTLAEAEKRDAVKDKAIQWVSGELLVIGFSLNESTRFEQLSNRLLTALSTTPTDKVLVSVEELRKLADGFHGTDGIEIGLCPVCAAKESHTADCWLSAKLKEVGDES